MFLFDRKAQLITDSGYIFSSWKGVRFNLEYTTISDTGIPTAEIEILNIDKDLMNVIKNEHAVFSIGYGDYLGDLITGEISNIEIKDTIVFDIIGNSEINTKLYDNWYNKDVRENFIVEDIARNVGMKIEGTDLLKDYVQPNGYTVKGNAITSIQDICSNRGLKVTFRGDLIKIYKKEGENEGDILLDITSGLTNVTKYMKYDSKGNQDTTYDYVVHALPIPKLKQGMIIQIISDIFSGGLNVVDFEIKGRKNWKAKYYCKAIVK